MMLASLMQKIYASNDLDEKTIQNLKMQGAKIDVWGIGTKLITAFDQPALGGVYKLVAIEDKDGNMRDTLKISSNAEKSIYPGKKQVWRIQANSEKKMKVIGYHAMMKTQESSMLFSCSTLNILISIRLLPTILLVRYCTKSSMKVS